MSISIFTIGNLLLLLPAPRVPFYFFTLFLLLTVIAFSDPDFFENTRGTAVIVSEASQYVFSASKSDFVIFFNFLNANCFRTVVLCVCVCVSNIKSSGSVDEIIPAMYICLINIASIANVLDSF